MGSSACLQGKCSCMADLIFIANQCTLPAQPDPPPAPASTMTSPTSTRFTHSSFFHNIGQEASDVEKSRFLARSEQTADWIRTAGLSIPTATIPYAAAGREVL